MGDGELKEIYCHLRQNTNLKSVVGPRSELEHARLFVKGKILDIDLATGFVDGRRFPLDQTVVIHRRFSGKRHLKIAIRTVRDSVSPKEEKNKKEKIYSTNEGKIECHGRRMGHRRIRTIRGE